MKNELRFSIIQKVVLITCIFLVIFFQLFDLTSLGYAKDIDMITNTLTRCGAGIVLILVLNGFGKRDFLSFKQLKNSLMIMIPALLIAINNFPISAYFYGRARLEEPFYRVILFFIECLSVGFFEEVLFRGIILVLLIENIGHRKGGTLISVIISSLIFGVLHLINLVDGSSLQSTMLQVGYSFLMGMLWAIIYLKTGNIWVVMILHATYNFFGQVMFYLGVVENRYDFLTILVTVVLAILVTCYALVLCIKGKWMITYQSIGESHEI